MSCGFSTAALPITPAPRLEPSFPPAAVSLPPARVSLPPVQVSLPPRDMPAAAAAQRSAAPARLAPRPESIGRPPTDLTLPTPSFHVADVPEPSSLSGRPHNTLVSSADEAEDLRRRISLPGLPEVEEIDLEEIEELDARQPPSFASSFPPLPMDTVGGVGVPPPPPPPPPVDVEA